MSDEHHGQSENGAKPDLGAPPLSSRARTAPVIEAEAAKASPSPETTRREDPEEDVDGALPVKSVLRRLVATAFIGAFGLVVYNNWSEWVPSKNGLIEWVSRLTPPSINPKPETPPTAVDVPKTVANKADKPKTVATRIDKPKAVEVKAVETPPEPAPAVALAPPNVGPAPVVIAPNTPKPAADDISKTNETKTNETKTDEAKTDEAKTVEAPPEPVKTPVAEAATEKGGAEAPAPLAGTPAAADEAAPQPQAVEGKPGETKSADAAAESVKTPVAGSETEKALAETTNRLAATQSVLDQVTTRLQAVEGQLAAPKTDSRALAAEREAAASRAGNASARIVAAQSLLSAIRQGDDYAPMLAALENLGGDPERVALLRAGLSAPNDQGLAKDFAALAAKTLAAALPPPPPQAKAPESFAGTLLAFIENRAEKLVRIRPDGAPGDSDAAIRVGRIEKDLARGDIAAALAERAQLPAPALVVTAAWAAKVQARIDAEVAAKAELAAALQELSKSKS